ncbi:MAG: outer membrane beta-barrel protein [Bdellovibrionaceae bacterium]|nr:outer membrane beta-barrel protein [Bdellovibrio sp.]
MNFYSRLIVILFAAIIIIPLNSEAIGMRKKGGKGAFAGGSVSAGIGLAFVTADQSGINDLITSAKSSSAATTGNLSSGYELTTHLTFRFSNNLVAIQLRPSYFTQETAGTGSLGNFNYKLTGFTVFPMVRLIPLANEIIDFYVQGGIGYGKLDGDIVNGGRTAKFSGSGFGMQAGLGADFCFVPDHCFGVEGNYRYLPLSRNIVSSSTGLIDGASQSQPDRELENANGSDVATTMSGISGALNYTIIF